MQEEFYCSLKLISGEEIFSLVSIDENNGHPMVVLQNPVVMKIFSNDENVMLKIKNWMDIPSDDIYFIPKDKIITMTEVQDKVPISYYNKFIYEKGVIQQNTTNKLTPKMGYLGNVESVRKKLEDVFKLT
jgi:hypothetical protein